MRTLIIVILTVLGLMLNADDAYTGYLHPRWDYTAEKLVKLYSDNEIKADNKLKGEVFAVIGRITSITSTLGSYYVTLSGGMDGDVLCEFSSYHKDTLMKLKKGNKVRIIGKCDGLTIGSVTMTGCNVANL